MRMFPVIDFQHLLLALFLGCIAAIVIYMGFRHNSRPVPAVLVFLYTGFVVWAICYVFLVGFSGGAL
jgi:hypothetical protein